MDAVKSILIEDILTNPVYTPESGLVCNLRKALSKLSRSDLHGLDVIIKQKVLGPVGKESNDRNNDK